MKSDIEISKNANLLNINDIANKLNLSTDDIECYGKYKAKINTKNTDRKGKLILVTSINPTPYGEGKTTICIGINDSLNKLGKKSVAVLREPSLGPVFGIKGGATGGGYSQAVPMEDINLHFTGDIHAIELANNLICAIIDNHIFQGNLLNIDKVTFNRCVDLNDRALRNITINSKYNRSEHFNITVASEIMAILCLSKDIEDLKKKLDNILVGYDKNNKMIFLKELNCTGAIATLLKDAIKPNLVQSLENNPIIIHGGPFANIAHGCNSLIATNLALSISDYVVTEAGFGADLGAEKFFDIKSRIGDLKPDCVVLNTTIRALKYNADISKEDVLKENLDALKKGICNLERHIENISKFTKNIVVCINKFDSDSAIELDYLTNYIKDMNILVSVSTAHLDGGNGSIDLANKIINICNRENDFKYLYDPNDTIINKINKICKEIYRAENVIISDEVLNKINIIEQNNFGNLPICIAKTQYSFSDNPKLLGAPTNFNMTVTDIKLNSGAGFIVVLMGDIMTLPGLSKNSAYLNIDITEKGITGLF